MSSKILSKFKDKHLRQFKERHNYEARINKSLYYVNYPKIDCLSLPLTELATEIFSENRREQSLDRLHYSDAVTLSWHACVSPLAFVMAAVYLDRLKKINPEYLQNIPSSDLFLVSLMISYKFMCDDGDTDEVFMDEWATSARISVKELVQLEREFLKAIDWRVFIEEPEFWSKLLEIETVVAKQQGTIRGFFTYTELHRLLSVPTITCIHKDCLLTLLSCLALYVSSLMIIIGTTLTVNAISMSSMYSIPEFNTRLELFNLQRPEEIYYSPHISNNDVTTFCNETSYSFDTIDRKNETENNVQNVSWDWWSIPSLNWIIETSQYMNAIDTGSLKNPLISSFSFVHKNNVQEIEIEEILQKGTKTRLQDQMESSWHKEWTDTIFKELKDHIPQNNVINLEL